MGESKHSDLPDSMRESSIVPDAQYPRAWLPSVVGERIQSVEGAYAETAYGHSSSRVREHSRWFDRDKKTYVLV